MIIIEFVKDKQGFYDVQSLEYGPLNNLALFLENEIVDDVSWWISFLEDKNRVAAEGNICIIDKKDDKVFIKNKHAEDWKHDETSFVIDINALIFLVEKWINLYNYNAFDKIILKKDNSSLQLVGISDKENIKS